MTCPTLLSLEVLPLRLDYYIRRALVNHADRIFPLQLFSIWSNTFFR